MTSTAVFSPGSFGETLAAVIPAGYLAAFDEIWSHVARPGRWFTGAERIEIAEAVRAATPLRLGEQPPAVGELTTDQDVILDTVQRIVTDPGRLSREWFDEVTGRIGLGRYAELVAVVVQVLPVDRFCDLTGRKREPFLAPVAGEPTGGVPDGIADDGAWLPMRTPFRGPNVARALSYVPEDNMMRLGLVRALYSGDRFGDMIWEAGALSRPQVELVAARTSSLNECFY